MTLRTFILAAIAVLLAFANLNVWLFSLIDDTVDRLATQRVATKFDMQIKNASYACYQVRRKVR